MDPRISSALDFCAAHGLDYFVLAFSFPASMEDLRALRGDSRVLGVVVLDATGPLRGEFGSWLGSSGNEGLDWSLPPGTVSTLVYVGVRRRVTLWMLMTAYKRGFRRIVLCSPSSWVAASIGRLILNELISFAASRVAAALERQPWGARRWRGEANTFRTVLPRAAEILAGTPSFVNGRVVLVSGSLGNGGTERQVVNTAKGLVGRHSVEGVTILCDWLSPSPRHGFFLPLLNGSGVEVCRIAGRTDSETLWHERPQVPRLSELLKALPSSLLGHVNDLIEEFRARRPEVVHGWQDSTCIQAGVAAVLAGVPRVVLAGRALAPIRFGHYRAYMKAGYLALAERPNVVLVNNSLAGARDYASWLDLPPSRFLVIGNGVDLLGLTRPSTQKLWTFKASLGIPVEAPVVGAILRFSREKRPRLWVAAAARILERLPRAHFLLAGDGPLRPSMECDARKLGLGGRIHLIGLVADAALVISAMDVFLLTSRHEGIPNVILESQWLGVPVVATEAGGTSEAIRDGETGWIVQSDRPEDLADRVVRVLEQEQVRAALGEAGRSLVRRRFSVERMIEKTLAAYGFRAAETLSEQPGQEVDLDSTG